MNRYEEETEELERIELDVITPEELEKEIFLDEVNAKFDEVLHKIHEGIRINKTLEYYSDKGWIWSFEKDKTIIFEVIIKGDKENRRGFFYLKEKTLFNSFLLNIINRMEIGQLQLK